MAIQITPGASVADTYRRLMEHDPNLHPNNFDTTSNYCDNVFRDNKPIDELLKPRVVNLGGIEWNFELYNGIRSLVRRGFYKIVETPFQRNINGIMTWSATVLYSPSQQFSHYFKFTANVGPIVNIYAMCFNLSNYGPETFSGSELHVSKAEFFTHMIGKVFYVSQQMYVENNKQTVWLKFQ